MKSQNNNLEFFWDKKEQLFAEQQELKNIKKNNIRDIDEYFKFLTDIEPGVLSEKEILVDKQFTF
ncbi:MAG: hypothetical protein PVI26_12210 [Chitinispirillia bacterium]|jgi:hypothetical protein